MSNRDPREAIVVDVELQPVPELAERTSSRSVPQKGVLMPYRPPRPGVAPSGRGAGVDRAWRGWMTARGRPGRFDRETAA
jgi:hypothetical protein